MEKKNVKTDEVLAKRIKDSIEKMKMRKQNQKGVWDTTEEIEERGRTDHVRKDMIKKHLPSHVEMKEAKLRRKMRKNLLESRREDLDIELMKKYGLLEDNEEELEVKEDNPTEKVVDEKEEILNEDETEETTEEITDETTDTTETPEETPAETETTETTETQETTENTDSENDEEQEKQVAPEDEKAIFDTEDKLDDIENPADETEDIDQIISNLLKTEGLKINVDMENSKVEIEETEKKDESSNFDFVEFTDEKSEVLDTDADKEVEESEKQLDEIEESIDKLVKAFGTAYPKIFNESTLKQLRAVINMFSEAKAKKVIAERNAVIVKKVDAYMESVKADFIKKNANKLTEAVKSARRNNAIEKLEKLIEKKLASENAEKELAEMKESSEKTAKRAKRAIKVLNYENKKLREEAKKLMESLKDAKKQLILAEKKMKLVESRKPEEVKVVREQKAETQKFEKLQKPVRRSDGVLTVESIKRAIQERKQEELTEDEIEDMRTSDDSYNGEVVDMEQFEKHIY
jgi:hypothetical protein